MDEQLVTPAFEVTDGKGRSYKIWADGRTEGFEDVEPRMIMNRIPVMVCDARPKRKPKPGKPRPGC